MVMDVQMLKRHGYTDADQDGEPDGLGIAADGTVVGSDGYGIPADTNNNGIADHLDANDKSA